MLTSEKVLGELYAWDSAIEDDFARPEGERDEDRALEAYEEIIMAAGASEGDEAADQVLSLAAMLLTKHFFRFPHVQLNVVNALLQLCGAARAQAVRIHSVRSLLSIVKTPASDFVVPDVDNAIAWVQRIDDVVASMRADEASSSVLLRQISPLADALKVAMDMLQTRKLGKDDAGDQHQPEGDAQDGEGERERDRPAKKPKLSLEDEPMSPASGRLTLSFFCWSIPLSCELLFSDLLSADIFRPPRKRERQQQQARGRQQPAAGVEQQQAPARPERPVRAPF